ncbi:CAP domain-containing protein [Tsuneonella sp. HG222]
MRTGSLIVAVVALGLGCAAGAQEIRLRLPQFEAQPSGDFAWRLLARHNLERDRKGADRLRWSQRLAQQAQTWAERLARENRFEHADYTTRAGAGENLWMGSAGYYDADQMIDTFLNERRYYKPGPFPQNSSSGRWQDVAHYTQIIWPETQEVGCAVAKGRVNDVLVCRYWPAGNTVGVSIN